MKTYLVAFLVLASAVGAQAQGTVLFKNFDAETGLDAPVFRGDDLTRLSGTNYMVELVALPSASGPPQSIAVTPFLSGPQAGYFDAGIRTIPGVPSGSNTLVVVRVWNMTNGSSFITASASGAGNAFAYSSIFQVTLGTATSPAKLKPLSALWLNYLDYPPPHGVYMSFNNVDGTVVVSYATAYLFVSTNLVQWTVYSGPQPQIFPRTQGSMFFWAR